MIRRGYLYVEHADEGNYLRNLRQVTKKFNNNGTVNKMIFFFRIFPVFSSEFVEKDEFPTIGQKIEGIFFKPVSTRGITKSGTV